MKCLFQDPYQASETQWTCSKQLVFNRSLLRVSTFAVRPAVKLMSFLHDHTHHDLNPMSACVIQSTAACFNRTSGNGLLGVICNRESLEQAFLTDVCTAMWSQGLPGTGT
jgi:hypothetical protein